MRGRIRKGGGREIAIGEGLSVFILTVYLSLIARR